jgi:phospholipid transport system substrate-binding protein
MLFLQVAAPQQFVVGSPAEQVKDTVNRVLSIVREHPPSETEKLEAVISGRFDFEAMAKRSLGAHWRDLTPQQQKEFVTVFTKLLRQTYLDQIKAYNNQKVSITGERRDGSYATVESRIVPQSGDSIDVNYRLHLIGDQWKVYDVVIENVSLVNNYRAQFNRVLVNGSYEELMRRMENREKR